MKIITKNFSPILYPNENKETKAFIKSRKEFTQSALNVIGIFLQIKSFQKKRENKIRRVKYINLWNNKF